MRKIQVTDLWSKVYKVSTVMVLSVGSLCVGAFVCQIVAIHWVESLQTDEYVLNKRPIIGILAMEYHDVNSHIFNGSYIASSYVKAVESSGARVVPIFIGKDFSYYKKVVDSINGIVFPGGSVNFWDIGGYGEAAKTLYKLIMEANQRGKHFSLYGICLGFEVLPVVSTGMNREVLENIRGTEDVSLTLEFAEDSVTSYLYGSTPSGLINLLKTRKLTANHHSQCFTPSSLVQHKLTDTWRVLTTSQLQGGKTFISSIEHVKYPQIFGTQFHPEKVPFEWTRENSDPHGYEAILANRWFYDYFVQNARLNSNRFQSEDEEKANLIYNYAPQFLDGYFEQIYWFESAAPVSAN